MRNGQSPSCAHNSRVIGVINCDKGIDARRSCGFKLFELNLAFICGQRRARGALEPYGWHIEFNDLDAWNGAQPVFRGFNHASNTPMLVQRHAWWRGEIRLEAQTINPRASA